MKKILGAISEATGVRALAELAVNATDAIVNRAVALARESGVSERKIQKALRARQNAERLQSLIALLIPVVPNPALLRALAKKR